MSGFGVPTDKQLSKINKLAKRTLSKDEVFVFPSKLAGDMIIPNRYVQLTKELLDVFSSDANKGVSLLLDHSWAPDGFFGLGGRPKMAMSYGRTFDSKYENSTEEGETISLVADHYMVRGIELDGIKTDDLIASIEAGTLFDSSIGFSYSKATCSVCGDNYYNCNHYKGKTYDIEDEDGVTRQKLCYIKAKPPGFLMENSLVFDGAYPGAGVLSKAGTILENETGIYQVVDELKDIDPTRELISTYSQRTGLVTMVKKSDHKKVFNIGGVQNEKEPKNLGEVHGNALRKVLKGVENSMNEKTLQALETLGIKYVEGETTTESLLDQLGEKWDEYFKGMDITSSADGTGITVHTVGLTETLKPQEGQLEGYYMTKEEVSEKLGEELDTDTILKLAKEGKEYRKELSDEAIAMGVRAMGNDFTKETWEKSFAAMSTNDIKNIMKTWELQANASIPAGRKTDPAARQGQQTASVPAEAFKI